MPTVLLSNLLSCLINKDTKVTPYVFTEAFIMKSHRGSDHHTALLRQWHTEFQPHENIFKNIFKDIFKVFFKWNLQLFQIKAVSVLPLWMESVDKRLIQLINQLRT